MKQIMNRFLILALSIFLLSSIGRAETLREKPLSLPVYDADPQHLWNRLHESLFVRVGPDGQAYGQDRLEPLLWAYSKHLLEKRSHDRAIAVLQEFLDNDGEKLIEDPLRRALLQRDLWMVFNWLEQEHRDFEEPTIDADEARAAQQRLRRPLAAVIHRLALVPNEIRNLPDNYAAAVEAGEFAGDFDPEQPDNPYLPADLFAAEGPWVCVGRSDGITAPQHLREENPFTNSVFLVFLRLPAGRAATKEYLDQLLAFDQPLVVSNPEQADRRRFPFVPNATLPQFPKGTQLALVRRAMLIDSSHRVTASPLTESVQLRVIHGELPDLTKQVLEDAGGSSDAATKRARAWQSFQEVRLSRVDLIAGQAGGLLHITDDERDFKTGFNAHPWDEFERPGSGDTFLHRSQRFTVMQQCIFCHTLPGVYSFNSFSDFRSAMVRKNGDSVRPFPLSQMAVMDVAQSAVKWKEEFPSWTELRKLLEE